MEEPCLYASDDQPGGQSLLYGCGSGVGAANSSFGGSGVGSLARASSFATTAPRTREERLAARHKELLERGRLRARPGHGHVTAETEPLDPIRPDPASALYESNTFQRDAATLFRQEKADKLCRQQMTYERKREAAALRESARWEQMAALQAAEAQRVAHNREAGLKGKRNLGSEHFNIVTLAYNATPQGQALRYKDEVTRYRAVLRSQNLFNRSHSTEHNIITGQPRHNVVALPPAPTHGGAAQLQQQQR